MTKSELIAKLAARYPQLVAKDAELAVKMMLDAMAKSLAQGQRIEIRGFGSFGLNYRPPRTGRNPKSGEKVQVPAKYVPHFKAGQGTARACRHQEVAAIDRAARVGGGIIERSCRFFCLASAFNRVCVLMPSMRYLLWMVKFAGVRPGARLSR